MGKHNDTMIIEVSFCKCKKTLIIGLMEPIPSGNICGDVGHRQVLRNVCEEQTQALVSSGFSVCPRSTCTNLQGKLHEKRKAIN